MFRTFNADQPIAKPRISWWRVLMTQLFLLHVGTYAVVITGLFFLNVLVGIHQPWFLLPAFGWGLFVALHGLLMFLVLNIRFARGIAARTERRNDPAYRPLSRPKTEIEQLIIQGRSVLDQLRAAVRMIPNPEARNEAFATCEASAMVLDAIEEHPDEVPLARDFVHRFLQPAAKLIGDYARLATRNVPSAHEMLREVETKDLPRLTARANAMFDRVHRGTIIDLAVAREMMALDLEDTDLLLDATPPKQSA
jgi:hypothetical protein